ncbi:unnamed protein product, partial [Discosporangium mesarthrocarpum]
SSGWTSVWSELHGAFYYHNLETNETSWDRPSGTGEKEELPAAKNAN